MAITLLMLIGLLLAALLLEPLARLLRLPFAALLVAAGFIGSELLVAQGIDTGVRADNFADLVVTLLLPLLVFQSAYRSDPGLLLRCLPSILVLAIPVLLLAVLLTATGVYLGIDHPGFPWVAALLTGVLLSATEPVAINERLGRTPRGRQLLVVLDGESLLNDTLVIVLFSLFMALALDPAQTVDWNRSLAHFALLLGGGIAVGLATGGAAVLLLRLFHGATHESLITIVSAYGSLLLAQQVFAVSGIVATLCTGLVLGAAARRGRLRARVFVDSLWQLGSYVAQALLFVLMGVTVTVGMFIDRWIAILIAIAAMLVARAVGIGIGMVLLSPLPGTHPQGLLQGGILVWGGLRGAVTLALALALPVELEYWWTIQSIAFGVVIFTLFVQAPTLPLLLRRLPDPDNS